MSKQKTNWIPGENCGFYQENFWETIEIETRKIPKSHSKDEDFSNIDFLKLLQQIEIKNEIQLGSTVSGKVTGITKREIIIDINYKDFVYVPINSNDDIENIKIGDELKVLVVEVSDSPFMIKGSISELETLTLDSTIKQYYSDNTPLKAKVLEIIPAGYNIQLYVNSLVVKAFMPNTLADVNRLADSSSIVGEIITVCMETLQQDLGAYVVSRKKYLETLIPEKIKTLKKNKVYTGFVTGTTPFGVFVQFEECLTGMIHKANINEKYREHIQSVKSGTPIDFYCKEILKGGKIILTQILQESLWDTIRVNQIFKGKVKSVKNFGALISLDYETMGLLQSSYLTKNNKTLLEGDEVEVRVVSIMRDDRKLYLTFSDDETFKDRDKKKLEELKNKYEK